MLATLGSLPGRVRSFVAATRPIHPDVRRAMTQRWDELPAAVKTPAQMLGQRYLGCEGTHGVFPRCDLACRPCYHSRDANRVRIDADHTLAELDRQMRHMRARRGPGQHAQLIGGEVTLLGPETHARALAVMHAHDRKPMSMSHGDFDYDYLVALTVTDDGRRRFDHVSFAVHVDATMTGRRAVRRPASEAELHPERERISAMFDRLRREHGVRSYLAHNMTVTPANLDEVPDVVRACRRMGYRMMSFQPAANVGHRTTDREGMTDDDVWRAIERGAGTRLSVDALQVGDPRCNRTVWGFEASGRYVPLLDDRSAADLRARDLFMSAFPGVDFAGPRVAAAARIGRVAARHPSIVPAALGWAVRFGRRAGPMRLRDVRPLTFVMHSFMDARTVRPAWDLLRRGETAADADVRDAQERLLACAYLMSHPDTDELVPACAQHAVLDPDENRRLAELLPRFGHTRLGADDRTGT